MFFIDILRMTLSIEQFMIFCKISGKGSLHTHCKDLPLVVWWLQTIKGNLNDS